MRRILIALALSAAGMAQAATVSVFNNLAAWEAAISGSAQLQDFSGYANGTDLTGVDVLPGVTLSSNIGPVEVFGASKTAAAFGPARQAGNGYFEAQYALPFLAAALDIVSFESIPGDGSTAVDQGLLSFLFSDGTTRDLAISGGDGSPIFIGIVSDSVITSFRWTEAHEANGVNEESALDNLRVAMRGPNQLPLPGSLPLVMLALAAVPMARRRR
ncbi:MULTISPECIES: hypothetical protein [unclassified Roseateles]|uniref:hypothetical protein n=1 Tax=unclassified Roseateles TaxID=2626991 RepID=UPI0006FB8B8D|nr:MULTISPECIES: hypothetical protein [unclassified Roseateles]KQW45696.1 hypothetical protein ASC81_12460 [Pelomonas sp. Root405]KRA72540.1 hypothetical protein ASD88_12460 [Pelomonas sp. Root662]